jgi:hypothetical protein
LPELPLPAEAARAAVRKRKGLLAEDIARELLAPLEWVEEMHWRLPHHVLLRTGDWFVLPDELDEWRASWERTRNPHRTVTLDLPRSMGGVEIDNTYYVGGSS